MESSTTSATAGMSLQRAECTPPVGRLAEGSAGYKVESGRRGYHSDQGRTRGLRFLGFALGTFLDAHVLEFAGFEDFAALEAFYELGVLVAAHDLHAWVFARL